jgi:hypothetical protein
MFSEIEAGHPFLKETLLSAMGNIEPQRLLDPRYLDADAGDGEAGAGSSVLLPVLTES